MDRKIKTKAYTYFLPFISDEAIDIKRNLVNVFLYDEDRPDLDNHIFLLYKFSADDEFLRFEEEVTWSIHYETQYDCDKYHIMVVFRRPERYKKDIKKLLDGKYSELNDSYKKHIIRFHELPDFSQIVGVLYRKEFAYKNIEKLINKDLPEQHWTFIPREQEASSIFNIKGETYTEAHKVKDVFETNKNFINEGNN